jgi:hypothetical protein
MMREFVLTGKTGTELGPQPPESDSLPPYCGSPSAPEHGAPACKPNCSSVLIGTKRMFGRSTASAIASASI